MLFVAHVYQDERGCAWRSMASIAADVDKSEGYTRRLIAGLVGKGRLRRHAVLRGSDESQTSNEYEIVGYSPAVDEAARRKADARLYVKPQRSVDQAMVRRGGRQRKQMQLALGEASGGAVEGTAGLFADVRGGEAVGSVAGLGDASGEQREDVAAAFADVRGGAVDWAVENARAGLPPANISGLPGANIRGLPIDLVFDLVIDSEPPPYPLLHGAAAVEKLPGMTKARATASAEATATTPSLEAAKAQAESGGGVGMRPGGARGLAAQRVGRALEMLEGEDAVVALEVERVMQACGFTPGPLGATIREALRLRMQSARCCAAAAGDLAIQRWQEYGEFGPYLRKVVSAREFYRSGVWLAPRAWPVDSRLRDSRQPDARIGMWRG